MKYKKCITMCMDLNLSLKNTNIVNGKKNTCISRREVYRMYFGKEIFQFFVPKIE